MESCSLAGPWSVHYLPGPRGAVRTGRASGEDHPQDSRAVPTHPLSLSAPQLQTAGRSRGPGQVRPLNGQPSQPQRIGPLSLYCVWSCTPRASLPSVICTSSHRAASAQRRPRPGGRLCGAQKPGRMDHRSLTNTCTGLQPPIPAARTKPGPQLGTGLAKSSGIQSLEIVLRARSTIG